MSHSSDATTALMRMGLFKYFDKTCIAEFLFSNVVYDILVPDITGADI